MSEAQSGVMAFLEQTVAYWADPHRGPKPPKPPSSAIAAEVALAYSKSIAIVVDHLRTGETTAQPSSASILDAARLMDCIRDDGSIDAERWTQTWKELGLAI